MKFKCSICGKEYPEEKMLPWGFSSDGTIEWICLDCAKKKTLGDVNE